MPAWTNEDGLPLSWPHYVYGMAYLRRASVREQLRTAEAVHAAGAVPDDYERWRDELRREQRRG